MRIICKWVFKNNVPGVAAPQMKAKQRYIEEMTPEEFKEMVITLLSQSETIRLILEIENESNVSK